MLSGSLRRAQEPGKGKRRSWGRKVGKDQVERKGGKEKAGRQRTAVFGPLFFGPSRSCLNLVSLSSLHKEAFPWLWALPPSSEKLAPKAGESTEGSSPGLLNRNTLTHSRNSHPAPSPAAVSGRGPASGCTPGSVPIQAG